MELSANGNNKCLEHSKIEKQIRYPSCKSETAIKNVSAFILFLLKPMKLGVPKTEIP